MRPARVVNRTRSIGRSSGSPGAGPEPDRAGLRQDQALVAQSCRAIRRSHLRGNRLDPRRIYPRRVRQLFPKLRQCTNQNASALAYTGWYRSGRIQPECRPDRAAGRRIVRARGRVLNAHRHAPINRRRSRRVDTVSSLPASESDTKPYLPISDPGDAHKPIWRVRSQPKQNR